MQRNLTVSSMYRPRGKGEREVPYLRMSGDWLRRAGFRIGERITVVEQDGQLVIRRQQEVQAS